VTFDDSGAPIPPADPSTPFSFTPGASPVFCDLCGVQLVTGDQVVGNGQPGTPYRHAAENTATYRDAAAEPNVDDQHTRS
jgi:hypothetical protein